MVTEPTPLSHCIQDREIGVLGAGLERCRARLDKHDAAINKLDKESRELALQQIENISELGGMIKNYNEIVHTLSSTVVSNTTVFNKDIIESVKSLFEE